MIQTHSPFDRATIVLASAGRGSRRARRVLMAWHHWRLDRLDDAVARQVRLGYELRRAEWDDTEAQVQAGTQVGGGDA